MNLRDFFLGLAALVFFLIASVALTAQGEVEIPVPIEPGVTVGVLLDWYNALYGVLVLIAGYLVPFIPGAAKLGKKVFAIAAAGLVLLVVFVTLGLSSSGFGLALTFLAASGVYDYFLKPAGLKSPPLQ
jgi:uncharacterized membrane protein